MTSRHLTLSLTAAALASACGTPMTPSMKPAEDKAEYSLGRLVVADATTGKLTVIDLDDRTTPGTLMLDNPGTVYASATNPGGFVFATQRMQNRTQLVESGTEFEEHGDHYHVKKKAPSLKPTAITGALPTHYTHHQGWTSLFNDGDGTVDFINDTQLARGELTPRRAATGTAHHGVALVHGERLVATMSMPSVTMLPDGGMSTSNLAAGATDRALSAPDTVIDTFASCTSLHGEFTTASHVVFGCANGALAMKWNAATKKFEGTVIPNPAGRMERVGTVEGHEKLPVFIGNFDRAPANGLAVIDPRSNTISPMALPTRRFAFRVDEKGEHVLVLTMDGNLHKFKLNAAGTALVADGMPLKVMPEYAMWPASPPRPAMTMGWDRVYVSDPRDGTVKEVKIEEWKLEHTFTVGGAPASLTLTSMSPDWASKGDHDHDHSGGK
ncbi:MAG: hypothetical protein INH41_25755 [Myxococcaceae bacterium]|nr:hypothetical protein [Myxococcaceae bacterium]MCA3015807.1 hypothetical protein [Myxococcaceae bacterium]